MLDVDFRRFSAWPSLDDYNEWGAGASLPVRFVLAPRQKRRRRRQGVIVKPMPYEERVLEHGEVPTRTMHWHDFFNTLIWARYPRAKVAITKTLGAARLDAASRDPSRGIVRSREQDRLACFDEGGLVLATFGDDTVPYVFGHAMYESIVLGRTDVRALTVHVTLGDERGAKARLVAVDAWLERVIAEERIFAPEVLWPSTPLTELLDTCKTIYGH
jgi:hypothetical protein